MISYRHSLPAYIVFAALTIPFGIAAHLIAELAGLGYHDDAELVFSAQHWYLAALAAASLASLLGLVSVIPYADRRRIVACLAADLPFAGQGFRFFALSFTGQFGFFVITQYAEGDPLRGGNLGVGLIAASIASAIGSLVITLCKAQILRVVVELFFLIAAQMRDIAACAARYRVDANVRVWRACAFTRVFCSRPPPHAARK
jgi:hypothetical protein